jgi:WD40 repeat protein
MIIISIKKMFYYNNKTNKKHKKKFHIHRDHCTNYHEGSRITSISWNRQVPHILASASENRKIVVWDLKINKSIFNFTEPSSNANVDDYFGSQS